METVGRYVNMSVSCCFTFRLKSISFMAENELSRSQSGSDEDASNSSNVGATDGELLYARPGFYQCSYNLLFTLMII